MKCPMCDGTGTSNTCVNGTFKPCSFCDGTGEFDPNEVDRFNAVDFIKVMEMVKKPMTNEEYIRTCSTEELAKLIYKIAVTDVLMDRFFTAEIVNAEIVDVDSGIKEAKAWLKEKHHE